MEPKKIVIAMDSFKGSATSLELADWLESGIHRVQPDIQVTKIPIADGGEGTIAALMLALNGRCLTVEVNNPLGEATKASLGITDQQVAFIEMAKASGITLIEQTEANALQASSYGLGQLIVAALDQGAKEIYVGIGGTDKKSLRVQPAWQSWLRLIFPSWILGCPRQLFTCCQTWPIL